MVTSGRARITSGLEILSGNDVSPFIVIVRGAEVT